MEHAIHDVVWFGTIALVQSTNIRSIFVFILTIYIYIYIFASANELDRICTYTKLWKTKHEGIMIYHQRRPESCDKNSKEKYI